MNPALLAAMRPRIRFESQAPELPPGAPSNLRTTAVSTTAVALAWDAPSGGGAVTGYDLLRGGVVIQPNVQTLSAVDATVTAGQGYSYTVRAVGPGGVGPESGALPVQVPQPGQVEPFYETDFEDMTIGERPQGGNADFSWGGTRSSSIETSHPLTGTRSLEVRYRVLPNRSWAEIRFNFTATQEYWAEYYTYIPSNFYRERPHSSNQLKFWTWWNEFPGGGYNGPGNGTMQLWATGVQGATTVDMAYNNRHDQQEYARHPDGSRVSGPMFGPAEFGQWHRIRVNVRLSDWTGDPRNGRGRLWRNDTLVLNATGLPNNGSSPAENFMTNAYIYGYDNVHFPVDTTMYVDHFKMWNVDPGW